MTLQRQRYGNLVIQNDQSAAGNNYCITGTTGFKKYDDLCCAYSADQDETLFPKNDDESCKDYYSGKYLCYEDRFPQFNDTKYWWPYQACQTI